MIPSALAINFLKIFQPCQAKFGNAVNYRGFLHVPGNDQLLSHPDAQSGGRRSRPARSTAAWTSPAELDLINPGRPLERGGPPSCALARPQGGYLDFR